MGHSKMPKERTINQNQQGVVRYREISSGEAVTTGRQRGSTITKTHWRPTSQEGTLERYPVRIAARAKYREAGVEWDERWILWPLGLLLAHSSPSSTKPNKIHGDQFQRAKANTEKGGHFLLCFGRHGGELANRKFIICLAVLFEV